MCNIGRLLCNIKAVQISQKCERVPFYIKKFKFGQKRFFSKIENNISHILKMEPSFDFLLSYW